nr:hypothetical protein [Spirochaetota bacterium]
MVRVKGMGCVGYIALSIITLFIVTAAGADTSFRRFRDDASLFEAYSERAKREETLADWNRAMQNGREEMRAAWERDADFRIAKELRASGDTDENRSRLESLTVDARALWERDADAAEASARGSWYARRGSVTRLGFDDAWLKGELGKSDDAVTELAGRERIDAWDADITPDAGTVNAQWESSLGSLLDSLRAKGDVLDAVSRKSYETEIVKIERELRDEFRLEKNSLVYSHRNRIIWDSLVDHESLRYKSEAESASAIADEILAETRAEITKEEEKVLGAKPSAGEGAGSVDFLNLGSDWERQIRELLEKGITRWQKAQEDLLGRMSSWKKGSEEALRDGEEAWQNAYNRLFDARKEWQKDLETEINAGIEAWQKRDQELAQNLEQAKQDLTAYMETMKGQWEGQSSGLADTMMTGSRIYGEAVDNIAWLSQMAARYATQGAYATGDLFSGVTDWTAWQAQQDRLKARLLGEKIISESNPPLWVTAKFEGVTYDDPNDQAVERYTVTLWRGFFNSNNETITWYNRIGDTSPETEKTPYFFYMREIDRWEQMRDQFSKLVGDAETAAHDANMAGIEGPGFLRNVMRAYGLNTDGENDPYLMTRAEFDYALAERERNYWRDRLAVAKDVLDYAYAEGPRESAADTEKNKADTEAAMGVAKTAYEASLGAIKGINDQLALINGKQPADGLSTESPEWIDWRTSIAYLSGELETRKGALAKAEEEYQKYAQALIVLENGQDADFMRREIVSLQSSLLATEKALDDARSAYFTSLRTAEGVDRMAQYAERANPLVYARMQARRDFDAYRGIVTGAESDASLESWGTALLDDANAAAVWTGSEERRAALAERYRSWKEAGDGERGARKEEFAAALREEYLSREISAAAGDAALGDFLNADFDPEYYRTTFNATFGEGDRAVLLQYALINQDALELVEGAMKKVPKGERSLTALMEKLPATGSYAYGGNNTLFLTKEAARRWTAERFADIDEGTWDAYADFLTKEISHADALVDMYEDFAGFESGYRDLVEKAMGGDEAAQRLVMEYAETGSTLAIAGTIAAYDGARAKHREVEAARNSFADEYGDYYAFSDGLARAADHVTAMIDYVNRGFGGGFMFSEDLSERTAGDLAGAARFMASYTAAMQATGKPVSAAMLKLSHELEAMAGEMDELLYVRDHAADLDYREALSARESEFAASDGAFRHVDYAEEVLSGQVSATEFGYGDASYKIIKTVLDAHGVLDAGTKEFLASHGSGDTAEYENFLTGAASLLDTYEIQHLALQFVGLGGGMTLDDFVATAAGSRGDVFKASLRDYITSTCLVDGGAFPADPDMLAAIALGITTDIGAVSALMERDILLARALAPRAMEELGVENDTRRRDAARARRLVAYHDKPGSFTSYRTNLTAVSALEAGAAGDLAVSQVPDGSTGLDRRDASGNIIEIFYAVPDTEGRALGSMIIEASNALASRMGEMFAAARPAGAADGELASVGQYLARLTADFDPNRTYAYTGGYEFDAALTALYDEATTVHAAKGTATLAGAEGEIASLASAIVQRESDVIQRASVYGVMGKNREVLRREMDAAGKTRGTLQEAYSKNAAELAGAQGRYQAANMKYIDGMNAVSSSYTAYKGAELAYERAYAVWEYAHTPYLSDTAAKEGGAGEGTLPGGETADLTTAPAPDAKERYARVKASFDAAEAKLATAKTALDSQETVEDLAGDAAYQAAREEFRVEAESYARTARAASMVEDDLGSVKAKVDLWQGKY